MSGDYARAAHRVPPRAVILPAVPAVAGIGTSTQALPAIAAFQAMRPEQQTNSDVSIELRSPSVLPERRSAVISLRSSNRLYLENAPSPRRQTRHGGGPAERPNA